MKKQKTNDPMEQIRLKDVSSNYFEKAWEIYEDAFPLEERRSLEAQALVLKKANYHFDITMDKKQLIGFLLWWNFETFNYIDHFATGTPHRNKGIGRSILEQFIHNSNKPVLLEVELPDTPLNKRRIQFYERIGFKLNQHYYEVPPSIDGQLPFQLLLMSYPKAISEDDVKQFIKKCHPIIFNKQS